MTWCVEGACLHHLPRLREPLAALSTACPTASQPLPFLPQQNVKNGGNRWATVLMYLTDVEEGGETGGWV